MKNYLITSSSPESKTQPASMGMIHHMWLVTIWQLQKQSQIRWLQNNMIDSLTCTKKLMGSQITLAQVLTGNQMMII